MNQLGAKTVMNANRGKSGVVNAYSMYQIIAMAGFLVLGCALAMGQSTRSVYLPMIFHAETQVLRTNACLEVSERVYPQADWWERSSADFTRAEAAFQAVITAMKNKDRATLLRLSDPEQAKDSHDFDQQAAAYFEQLAAVEIVAVPRAYEFDGLVVFFVKFRVAGKTLFAPFVFTYEEQGSLGFMPSRTQKVTFRLTKDWFDSKWGPSSAQDPTYCTDQDIKRATYSVPLVPLSGVGQQVRQSSQLFLMGAPVDTSGSLANVAARVRSANDALKSALSPSSLDDFVKHLTPEGGNRLRKWFASASDKERQQYIEAFKEARPFFFFDASSVLVVYAKTPKGAVQAMYFVPSPGNELLWTNSSNSTVADQVFKQGPLYSSASKARPFSDLVK